MSDEQVPVKPSPPAKPATPRAKPAEQFVTFVAFILGMVILIDQSARQFTGRLVGAALEPLIGFGKAAPAVTILLASVVMVVITSSVRHYFTDYLKQAKGQEVTKAFQREMRSARKEKNLHKMKRLTEKNQELMKIQAEQSSAQLKPMAITMVVVVPIFAWLLVWADPGSALPEVVMAHPDQPSANAWTTTPDELQSLGLPTAATALRAPDVRFPLKDTQEHAALVEALRTRGTDRINYTSPLTNQAAQYVVQFPNPSCETYTFVPWSTQRWCLDMNVQTQDSPSPLWIFHFFPRWVALYSLFSIPLGQVVQRALKARDLQAELAKSQGAP